MAEDIEKKLKECNAVEGYHDYHEGELESMKNDIYHLQRAVTNLIIVLVESGKMDLDTYLNK